MVLTTTILISGSSAHSPAGAGPRYRRHVLVALPVLLALLVTLVLTGLNLNGSSIGRLSVGRDSSLVAGTPQGIRRDEWDLTSPNIIGNVHRGLPVEPWVGLTRTFLPGSGMPVPTRHWSTLFKPHDWAFFVPGLGASRAFALHWWCYLLVGFAGVYALLFLLCRSVLVAAGIATMVTLAPITAWWSDSPALTIGYLAGSLAALLVASTRRRLWASLSWGALAGWLLVAGVLVLYPPWQVSLAWVCTGVGAGWLLDRRPRPSRVLAAFGALTAVTVGSLVAWYLQSRDAIAAIAHTTYPGSRTSTGGGGSLAWLLDAPSTLWLSGSSPWSSGSSPPALRPDDVTFLGDPLPFANASEVSSGWLPLPLLAVTTLVIAWALVIANRAGPRAARPGQGPEQGTSPAPAIAEGRPLLWTGVLTAAVILLLLAWTLLPVPDVLGTLTLLSRVPGRRMPVALALATGVLLAIGATVVRQVGRPRWLWPLTVLAALGTVAAMVWAVGALPWRPPESAPPSAAVAAVALVLAVGAGLLVLGRLRRTASLTLAVLALATYLPVNPVYRGLGPLNRDPVVKTLAAMTRERPGLRAVAYGHNAGLSALVAASGAQTLSGLTVYPDAAVWQQLAPSQEDNWNQYSKYDWVVDPTVPRLTIRPVSGTQQDLLVDPCSEPIRRLDIDVAVSPDSLDLPCLRLERVIRRGTDRIYLYVPAG